MSLLANVEQTISEQNLLKAGDRLLVALSGGPDSVALLHILVRLRLKYRLQLTAVYINHQIRKRAALKEEKFCNSLCRTLDVPLHIVREDIPALARREKMGLEEAGRAFRYELFERMAIQQKLTKVALGHHLDDRVETILFRIVRGTGRTGLGGIPVKRGKIIRPLFDISKAQILAYLAANKLTFCTDQSNLRSQFSRNYIRNRLLPELRRRLNPQVDRALLNMAETVAAEEELLEKKVVRAVKQSVTLTLGGKIELDRERFRGYTNWLRRRLLRYCLGSISEGVMIDRETVERIDDQILNGKGDLSLPGKIQAVPAGSKIVFVHGAPIQLERELHPGKVVRLTCPNVQIAARFGRKLPSRPSTVRRATRVSIDRDKVEFPLVVRTIRAGDRFRPLGLHGSKKVGDFLTDRKVPKVYRDEILVVTDDRGIIWVVGYEIADRVKVDKSTRKVVTLEVNIAKRALAPAV
jgi:tRNA(Ile)-lysidine synthase